ncbi:heavy metal-binding domain-containing protein, partial [bacterium]
MSEDPGLPPIVNAPPVAPPVGQGQRDTYTPGAQIGLPQAAIHRLREMRGTGDKPRLFTSDLSVNEFVLVKSLGFEPLGLVMGSSIYHVGFQFSSNFQSMELDVLTQALYHARELAMTRMEEEADVLGADGIVGVRLTVNINAWGENLAEFMAIGTAVKSNHGDHWRTPTRRPFTSELTGQDFFTLLKSGYRPVALTMGTCVYHVGAQGFFQAIQRIGRNIEMENYTQALYDARELAMSRMQAEAEREGAVGIVGSRVEETSHGWG